MPFNRSNISRALIMFVMLLVILVSSAGFSVAQEKGLESLKQSGQAFRSVAKKVSPAVVFIKVEKEVGNQESTEFSTPFNEDFFRRFFGDPRQFQNPHQTPQKRKQVGQGSGFLISPDGYILTNNHVAGDADSVSVQLLDGREYDAKIVGADPGSDLAVIKIDESDLPYLKLGSSEKLEVGDWVLAVGNPFGLSHTLTAGIVSAKGRSGIGLNDYEDFIQTDAAINPGNSGGPLVNLDGEVVGINSAIFSRSGGYMGIGFAIPIDMAKEIKDQLIEHGEVKRGRIGVYIQDMTKDLADSFNLAEATGILITNVQEGSPAADAELKQGDIILEIDGDKVDKVANFRNRIALTAPGTKVALTILRDGEREKITVKIGMMDSADAQSKAATGKLSKLGMGLQQLTPELADRLGYADEKGVLIASVESGSLADRAGIKRGSLILEIDRQPVTDVKHVQKLLETEKKTHLFLLREGDATRYVAIKAE